MIIRPKNWRDFQHYKTRRPPWIRLYRALLDDYEFQCLPLASKALAPQLWLLASESVDGSIDATPAKLAFRLRMTEREIENGLTPLIASKFFEAEQGAGVVLAVGKQLAPSETEQSRGRAEQNTTASSTPAWFSEFKLAYPPRAGDQGWGRAQKAANARIAEGHSPTEFVEGAKRYAAFCKATGKLKTEYVKQAATFLGPDKPFLQPWTPPPPKAQLQQDANVDAGLEWLQRSGT